MKSVLISTRPKWCEKICHEIGKEEAGKPIYEKRIEVRKTAPKEVPFKAYIYCTRITDKKHCRDEFDVGMWKGNEHVIGEFVCDKVYLIKNQGSRFSVADEEQSVTNEIARQSCLDYDDMVSYLGDKDGYGLHIINLKIYDKPKELSEFWGRKNCLAADTVECWNCFATCLVINGKHCQPITRPPQSWQYVEELCKAQN